MKKHNRGAVSCFSTKALLIDPPSGPLPNHCDIPRSWSHWLVNQLITICIISGNWCCDVVHGSASSFIHPFPPFILFCLRLRDTTWLQQFLLGYSILRGNTGKTEAPVNSKLYMIRGLISISNLSLFCDYISFKLIGILHNFKAPLIDNR